MARSWAPTATAPSHANGDEEEHGTGREPHFGLHNRRSQALLIASVAAGGAVGTLLRYEASLAIPASAGAFPTATLLVNISGSLLLGFLYASRARPQARGALHARSFFGAGILGAYTTWSTFVLGTDRLLASGHMAAAILYVTLTIVAGILAAALGAHVRRLLSRGRGVGGIHP